ncbi:MAG: HNH endonuclease signature motif containing protein, partial [Candidatus Binatia bacterium]
ILSSEDTSPDARPAALGEAYPDLDWSSVSAAIPAAVEELAEDSPYLDSWELDERMRDVLRAMQQIDWRTGRLLRTFFALRLHRVLGFDSAGRYVRERLGFSERKARALVAIDRKGWTALELADAYQRGELSWLRALTLLPVIQEGNAAAWVARSREVMLRRLTDEVEWALAMRDTVQATSASLPPPAVEPPAPGASLVLPERQMCAPGCREVADGEISFVGPASVVGLFRGVVAAHTLPGEPLWKGLERLLESVERQWSAEPSHRDPVFRRDDYRCQAPGCSSRRSLQDHHRKFRSRGGDNSLGNRLVTCAARHLQGIHRGYVKASGTAPDAIVWELGVRPGGEPLMRLHGERYCRGRCRSAPGPRS